MHSCSTSIICKRCFMPFRFWKRNSLQKLIKRLVTISSSEDESNKDISFFSSSPSSVEIQFESLVSSCCFCCCCCWLPDPFRGMGAWRETMEPRFAVVICQKTQLHLQRDNLICCYFAFTSFVFVFKFILVLLLFYNKRYQFCLCGT